MSLAVVICTHNRAEALRRTLGTLQTLQAPAGPWSVVVVDNASTDHTRQVVDDMQQAGRLPIQLLAADELGLSNARNQALDSCIADALIFLDDDVDVEPGLLVAYEHALQFHPHIGFFGGPIRPLLEDPHNPLAAAILHARPGAFSCVDLGRGEVRLEPGRAPFGANMCVRTSAVGATRFDARLSYHGRAGIVGDETDFFFALQAQGVVGQWVPAAVVWHRIPSSRATWASLERFARGDGTSLLRMDQKAGVLPPITPRLAFWYLRRGARAWFRARQCDRTAPLEERVDRWYQAWELLGAAAETRRQLWRAD